MLSFYKRITRRSGYLLRLLLRKRLLQGKEDAQRIYERMGRPSAVRPQGKLVWIHAASVGESQSALILICALLERFKKLRVLVTTGTVTSARVMDSRLPERSFHQFYPLDHPEWVGKFLDYWHPNAVFWMESELWPNMLSEINRRGIPATLVNGRLSPTSFRRWKRMRDSIAELLDTFDRCLVQTETDARYFTELGAKEVVVTDNIKYSAEALPVDAGKLEALQGEIGKRPVWLYSSTHEGEEALACRLHNKLSAQIPDLLTIIVPRHPDRGKEIMDICLDAIMNVRRRSEHYSLPQFDDDIYIADTLGELGLFYRLAPVACIGRSFSKDGGGGHNPIEAAQLECAVLHGPKVQNLQEIYDEMDKAGASLCVRDEKEFEDTLYKLLKNDALRKEMQGKALAFAQRKASVIDDVMRQISPRLQTLFADLDK